MEVIHTIGRRKTSVARLFLSKGKGNITVNKKDYFTVFSNSYITIQSKPASFINRKRRKLRSENHC